MVEKIIETGKTPIVPTIPYSTESAVGDNVPAYNARIEEIYKNYPEVIKGPDFYKFFSENPGLLSSDGVHPSEDGYASMRQLWAETMYDEIYSKKESDTEVDGDVNEDGIFNINDISVFRKFLTGKDVLLKNQRAGDLNKDNILNVFDLCKMKRILHNDN